MLTMKHACTRMEMEGRQKHSESPMLAGVQGRAANLGIGSNHLLAPSKAELEFVFPSPFPVQPTPRNCKSVYFCAVISVQKKKALQENSSFRSCSQMYNDCWFLKKLAGMLTENRTA
jgi:hypothetical protein